jgi:hypothetical protein
MSIEFEQSPVLPDGIEWLCTNKWGARNNQLEAGILHAVRFDVDRSACGIRGFIVAGHYSVDLFSVLYCEKCVKALLKTATIRPLTDLQALPLKQRREH